MSDKKVKKVQITENAIVDLIENIVNQTIEDKIAKGELKKVQKTKKVNVSESEYKRLLAAGKIISAKKK